MPLSTPAREDFFGFRVHVDSPKNHLKGEFPKMKERRFRQGVSVKSIVAQIDGDQQHPIDLTGSKLQKPGEQLKSVPRKYIRFCEDVRPPYNGTYTKIISPLKISRLSRNPFSRQRPDTNYDYDSEAEWEEPEEGEDLVSEDEEPDVDEEEDEMDGFLDDEDAQDAKPKRRALLGDLEPSSTGLCWADSDGPDLSSYAIDMLKGKALPCIVLKASLMKNRSPHPPHRPILYQLLASAGNDRQTRCTTSSASDHVATAFKLPLYEFSTTPSSRPESISPAQSYPLHLLHLDQSDRTERPAQCPQSPEEAHSDRYARRLQARDPRQ